MNDLAYYQLLNKLNKIEITIKEKIRSKFNFNWNTEPMLPLEAARLCAETAADLIDISREVLKEVDQNGCARIERSSALGDISTDIRS